MYVVYINLLYFLSISLFTYNKNLLSPPKKINFKMMQFSAFSEYFAKILSKK